MMWKRFIPYLAMASFYLGLTVLILQWVWPAMLIEAYQIPPETRRYFEISRKLELEAARLRDYLVADTVIPLISTERLTVKLPLIERNDAEYIRRTLDRSVPRDSKAAINVIAIPRDYGSYGTPDLLGDEPRYYAGVKGGKPYCAVAVPFWRRFTSDRVSASGGQVLGPCAFWARHGAPGAGIHDWLRSGGAEFATDLQNYGYSSSSADEFMMYSARQRFAFAGTLRGQKCQAGKLDACRSAVVQPATEPGPPTGAMRGGDPWNSRLFPHQGTMLGDIEREFGSERFSRFWTSANAVEPAFEASFGVSLPEWVSGWARERYGPREFGSRMSLLTILLSLVAISVFAGLAIVVVSRRRV